MGACIPTGLMLAAGSLVVGSPGQLFAGLAVLGFGVGLWAATRGGAS